MARKASILLIDDSDVVSQVSTKMLTVLGYQVTSLNNANNALNVFTLNPLAYDLIITDFEMPNMNGSELAIQLHKLRHNIPIILSTGNYNITLEQITAWEIDAIIFKPYKLSELDLCIKNVFFSFT